MATDHGLLGSPRRTLLIGIVLVVATITSAVFLSGCERPEERAGTSESPSSDVAVTASPLRLTSAKVKLVKTAPGALGPRIRRAGRRAATRAREILTGLYTEAFLDPSSWETGAYDDAFVDFSRDARDEAERRTALLTAGEEAGERYDEIRPITGRLATRILLDREGVPALMVSRVRFKAAALGSEPQTLRSTGQYILERIGDAWKIVSFHVIRSDSPRGAA